MNSTASQLNKWSNDATIILFQSSGQSPTTALRLLNVGLGKRVLDPRVGAGNTGTGRVRAGS
ncbi:hypothetical protein DVH24_006829 [Malus domestica]|uniref:Uncharacterized protein n=1 Tax=Malus domestica TaxID=3750 RepID=A0A498J9R9_MALDO|nr:hypothetical protein DVH24_006829 [Malus domestica]